MLKTFEEHKAAVENSSGLGSTTEDKNIGIWVKHNDGKKHPFRLSDLLKLLPETFPGGLLGEAVTHAALLNTNSEHAVNSMLGISATLESTAEDQNIGIWVKHDDGETRSFYLSDLLKPLPETFPVDLLGEVFTHAALLNTNTEHVVISRLNVLGYNISQQTLRHRFYVMHRTKVVAVLNTHLLVIFDQQQLLQKAWQSTNSQEYKPTLALLILALKSSDLAIAKMILQQMPEEEGAKFVETMQAQDVLRRLCQAEFSAEQNDEQLEFTQTLIDLGMVFDLEDANQESLMTLAARNNPELSALFASNLKLAPNDYDRAMRLLKMSVYEGDVSIVEAVLSQTRFNEYEAIMNGKGSLCHPQTDATVATGPGYINVAIGGVPTTNYNPVTRTYEYRKADDYAGLPQRHESMAKDVLDRTLKHHILRNLNHKDYVIGFPVLFIAMSKAHNEKYRSIAKWLLRCGATTTEFAITVYFSLYSNNHMGLFEFSLTDFIVSAGCLSMMYELKNANRLDAVTANVLEKYPVLFQDTVAEPENVLDRLQNVIRISCAKYVIEKTVEKTSKSGVTRESDGIKRAFDFFCDAASVCSSEQLPVLYYFIAKQLEISYKPGKTSGVREGSFMAELVDGLASEPHMCLLFGVQYQAKRADRKQNLKLIRQFCLDQSQGVDLSLGDECASGYGSMRPNSDGGNSNN